MSDEPVFVVGVPRSGTTLLSAMLAAHSRLDCGPETGFFEFWERAPGDWILAENYWPARALAFAESLPSGPQRLLDVFDVAASEIEAALRASSPSPKALLEAFTKTHALKRGKPRWVEKTPNHLVFLPVIRSLYPRAHFVRIVRDPRDVALSLLRVPFSSRTLLGNAYLWQAMDRLSWNDFERDRQAHTVRYEDLLSNPEGELRRLCDAVGESFQPAMLDPSQSVRSVAKTVEWWKDKVGTGLDPSRAAAWRSELSDEQVDTINAICADGLQRYGYEPSLPRIERVPVLALDAHFVARNEGRIMALSRRRMALDPLRYDGLPFSSEGFSQSDPLLFAAIAVRGTTTRERAADTWFVASHLARRRRLRQPCVLLDGAEPGARRGLADSSYSLALRLGCVPLERFASRDVRTLSEVAAAWRTPVSGPREALSS